MRIDSAVQSTDQGKSAEVSRGSLGKDDFLKLLVTQLQYQDPLNPTDNTQFVAQLAQFSSLEGITNLQLTAEGMKGSIDAMQDYSSTAFIGRSVKAEGNSFEFSGSPVTLGYSVMDNAASSVMTVRDTAGRLVRSVDLGTLSAGDHLAEWDGRDNNGVAMGPGNYTFMVSAKGADNTMVPTTTYVTGPVTGLSLDDSGAQLIVGSSKVARESIKAVF